MQYYAYGLMMLSYWHLTVLIGNIAANRIYTALFYLLHLFIVDVVPPKMHYVITTQPFYI